MVVQVRYFAKLREIAGRAEQSCDAAATVEDLFAQLGESYPSFVPLRPHLRAAVNHEFVDWTTPLADGDEVAFIPPVSGG